MLATPDPFTLPAVQTEGVVLVRVTPSPDVARTTTAKGDCAKVLGEMAAKEMDCPLGAIERMTTVKDWLTGVAAA